MDFAICLLIAINISFLSIAFVDFTVEREIPNLIKNIPISLLIILFLLFLPANIIIFFIILICKFFSSKIFRITINDIEKMKKE